MKFEKFMKNAGLRGTVFKSKYGDILTYGHVGMLIPEGATVVSANELPPHDIIETIFASAKEIKEDDLKLTSGVLLNPEDKSSDLIRVFSTEIGDIIGINDKQYGYLERIDRLKYLEIEDEEEHSTMKFVVVLNRLEDTVIGFIEGKDCI